MSHPEIKAVTFDAAGTLIHLSEPVGESYSRVARRHGYERRSDQIEAAFRAVWKRTPQPFSPSSTFKHEDERAWWKRVVFDVFTEAGLALENDSRFSLFFDDLFRHFETPGTWEIDEKALHVVQSISSAYPCAVLSNFDGRLRFILRDLGLLELFSHIFLSCELKSAKPSPGIFATAATALELAPSQILHVGDDPECDWAGASQAGFQVFRIGPQQKELVELLDELSLA